MTGETLVRNDDVGAKVGVGGGGEVEVDGVEIARIKNQTAKFKVHDFIKILQPAQYDALAQRSSWSAPGRQVNLQGSFQDLGLLLRKVTKACSLDISQAYAFIVLLPRLPPLF